MHEKSGLNFQQACDAYFSDKLSRLMRETDYSRLLIALKNGELKATGIRTKPTVELSPSPIPAFLFDKPAIDWFMDIIENAGSRFEQVRIHSSELRVKSEMGRPSMAAKIDRFLLELQAEGLDLNGNQKQICERVRQKAKAEDLSLNGFSDPVIKTRIRGLRPSLPRAR